MSGFRFVARWLRGLGLVSLVVACRPAESPSEPSTQEEPDDRAPASPAGSAGSGERPSESPSQPSPGAQAARGAGAVPPTRYRPAKPEPELSADFFELPLPEGSDWLAPLAFVPAGPGPHEVLVAAHGAGGTARAHCEYYRRLTESSRALLCLKGRALYRTAPERGYYFPDHHALEAEMRVATRAFLESQATRLVPRGWVYAGYSQGATMGALMVVEHGQLFSRLLLIEGGLEGWTHARAARFAAAGGERVLFVCGQSSCADGARRAVDVLERAKILARARHARGGGHTYLGAVGEQVRENLGWLLEPNTEH